jgi:hypothetical protein
MTFRTDFFFRPPSLQPTSIIYYVNNVDAARVLLRFTGQWPPQLTKVLRFTGQWPPQLTKVVALICDGLPEE